jgi:hypothetical protein
MTQTHTPGPEWKQDEEDVAHVEIDMKGFCVEICAFTSEKEEALKLGRLIVAAPELLSELRLADKIISVLLNALPELPEMRQEVYKKLYDIHDGEGVVRSHEREAAIAKAEGRG